MLLNNKPLSVDTSDPQDKATQVKRMFNRIAPTYNLLNDVISFGMHRKWKSFVAHQAGMGQNQKFLDLCTGSGDIAALIARSHSVDVEIIGMDFAEEMLNIARKNHPNSQISFEWGDATQLPFDDQSFDVVTIGYGLRNLSSISVGLQEIYRVLKPGGRLVSLDLGKPEQPLFKFIYYFFFNQLVPLLGLLIHGKRDPYQYLPDSLKRFPAQSVLLDMIQETGFDSMAYYNFAGGAAAVHVAIK